MIHRPSPRWLLVLAAAAALALTGCGGDDDEADGDTTPPTGEAITIITREFFFEPDVLTLPAGTIEITVDNSFGVVEHDFTVDELDIDIYAAPTEVITETVTLRAGTYDFYCSIPGHREAGMEGVLTVN